MGNKTESRLRGYRYRLYPTEEQKILIAKTIGCCRFVYNRALALKMSAYEKDKTSLSIFSLMNKIVDWKKDAETNWLTEVNSQSLQASLVNLDRAYTRFFREKNGFPNFKSKHGKNSFTNPQHTEVDFERGRVYIPKFKDGIKVIFDRRFKGKIKNSTVLVTPTGKYFISILVEEQAKTNKSKKPKENRTLGIDLGIKNYLTDSNGNVVENPKHLKKKLKSLKRQQRKLSRKKKGSKNRDKQRKKVARIYEKVTNTRRDFLHKLTTELVENQDYDSIAMENLDVQEMLRKGKKNKLSRYISDASWGIFRELLTYKCQWYGKNLLLIGRFDPSSKLCPCGCLNNTLSLKDRNWRCSNCGLEHNRDVLAANNIKRFAFCKQNTICTAGVAGNNALGD